jgi:hypothetical protein
MAAMTTWRLIKCPFFITPWCAGRSSLRLTIEVRPWTKFNGTTSFDISGGMTCRVLWCSLPRRECSERINWSTMQAVPTRTHANGLGAVKHFRSSFPAHQVDRAPSTSRAIPADLITPAAARWPVLDSSGRRRGELTPELTVCLTRGRSLPVQRSILQQDGAAEPGLSPIAPTRVRLGRH